MRILILGLLILPWQTEAQDQADASSQPGFKEVIEWGIGEMQKNPDLWGGFFSGVFIVLIFLGYFGTIRFVIKDASERGKTGCSGCLVVLLVALFPVLGHVIWLLARPPKISQTTDQKPGARQT